MTVAVAGRTYRFGLPDRLRVAREQAGFGQRELAEATGISRTTHTLRHRFATTAYAGSRDLLAVQTLLGHSRPETTQRYVALPDDALRASLRWTA